MATRERKEQRTGALAASGLSRLLSVINAPKYLERPPDGYFSVFEIADAQGIAKTTARDRLRAAYEAGALDRVEVKARGEATIRFYYAPKTKDS